MINTRRNYMIFVLLAIISLSTVIVGVQTARAANTVTTSMRYISVFPSLTGPGLDVYPGGLIEPTPPPDMEYRKIEYIVTCPNGTERKGNVTFIDPYPTGNIFYFIFTPTAIGTHSVKFHYLGDTMNNIEYSPCWSDSQNFEVVAKGFYVNAESGSQFSVKRGESVTYNLTLFTWGDFNEKVTVAYTSGCPKGGNVYITPSPFPWINSVMRIEISSTTPSDIYRVLFTGTGGGLSSVSSLDLAVLDFNISATPSKQYIKPGESTSYAINLSSFFWFPKDGNVTLGNPTFSNGISFNYEPKSISFSPQIGMSGASSSSNLVVSTSEDFPPGMYDLVIIGTAGELANQATVKLAVGRDMVVSITPENSIAKAVEFANFTAEVVSGGIAPFDYQWYDDSGPIYGKTERSLSVKESIGNHSYYCLITDDGGQVKETDKAMLSVSPISSEILAISSINPASVSVNENATLSVDADGGTKPYNYSWFDNAGNKVGDTSSIVVSRDAAGEITYYCVITDSLGQTKESSRVTLIVNPIAISSEIFVFIAILIGIAIASLVWWRTVRSVDLLKKIEKHFPGWKFYSLPTAGFAPGTIFSVEKDSEEITKVIDVPVPPCPPVSESSLKIKEESSSTLNQTLTGPKKLFRAKGSGRIDAKVVFSMENPVRETVNLNDLVKGIKEQVNAGNLHYNHNQKYFIIREARKTRAMKFNGTKKQVEKAVASLALPKNSIKQELNVGSRTTQKIEYPIEFREEMRLMYRAEPLGSWEEGGKLRLNYDTIRKVVEWNQKDS